MSDQAGPILHVAVVGFHHKKGCQVEYSFPPLVPGAPNECPPGWKYLPTLALPDGSHNFDEDTVYFHLPSLKDPKETVFGISCFRQIPVEKLKNRTADITRGAVQKSVCVLSSVPLYGHIQVKMTLITHAYFDEGDFSKVSLLEDTYHHLNSVMLQNDLSAQTFVGLSPRDFILQWKHKALLLFKLLLLEKRIVFYKSPVHPLCSTILTLISLQPNMIESGLSQSACIKLSRPMSPMPDFAEDDLTPTENTNKNSVKEEDIPVKCDLINGILGDEVKEEVSTEVGTEVTESDNIDVKMNGVLLNEQKDSLKRDASADIITEASVQSNMLHLAHLNIENCGMPLQIFTKGYLCLPYLSLPYMDLLNDINVRGYIVGATNVLFKQKRQLYDILIDIDNMRIECQDLELRKLLHLSTEDLRFADYIVKHVSEERHDVFLDGVGWEGGDEWIRAQFRIYLLCLLRTSLLQGLYDVRAIEAAVFVSFITSLFLCLHNYFLSLEGSRELDHFGASFMSAWRETHNYKIWFSGMRSGILEVNPGHPFAGQLSVADMKLRLSHTMQNTESGRKLNQAMASTGRAVATTSKAVGGAISQAKGAFSSWWSNLLVSPEPVQKAVEAITENGESAENENNSVSLEIPSETCQEVKTDSEENHKTGEVHTV